MQQEKTDSASEIQNAPELTQDEIWQAERELNQLPGTELEAAAFDKFLNVLCEWDIWEGLRVSSEEKYLLGSELVGIDRNAVVRDYASAKKAVIIIEKRMLTLMKGITEHDIDALMSGTRYVINRLNYTIYISVRKNLAERLKSALSEVSEQGTA